MNPLLLGGVVEAVGNIADNLFTSDKERLDAQIELEKLGIETQKIEAGLIQGQIDTNISEAKHMNVFVAGWRPAIGWIGALAMAYQFVAYPLLVWGWASMQAAGWISETMLPPPMLNADALWVILTGMLGIAGLRSVEKVKGVARG